MPQFAVCRNKNTKTRNTIPYLLDVQSDLLEDLDSRVVVPLYVAAALPGMVMTRLMPVFEITGKRCVMMTPQLAGIARSDLGPSVADLSASRTEIIDALDFLVTGI